MLDQITRSAMPWSTSPPPASRSSCSRSSFSIRLTTSTTRPRRRWRAGREDLAREALPRKAAAQAQIDGLEAAAPAAHRGRGEARAEAGRAAEAGQQVPYPEGDPEGPVHRGQGRRRGKRERRGHLQHSATPAPRSNARRTRSPPCKPGPARGRAAPVRRARRRRRRQR